MSASGKDLIVIPARYGSTRLPGKPLRQLAGRTLLERVIANARLAAQSVEHCDVIVATDDKRIAEHAETIGVAAVITPIEIDSGSARAHAAACARESQPQLVINLQGDAPFITHHTIAALVTALRDGDAQVATPVFQLDWDRLDRLRSHKQSNPFSGTTCVRDRSGHALWFSKQILPALRGEDALRREPWAPVWQHLGLYAYTLAALDWFVANPAGVYEILEGLEQLRFLENGWKIATIPVPAPEYALSGIDTEGDLALAEQAIERLGDPFPT
ncbi:3-deoxy-manno-octulosonate cytidylyltransferase (CMP-KDO synthetase) [Erythrobacter litoralis]|uniref:3-deoxy-manno-octulosonate cytidylyltransferase n=1 Tax=Erythrobacter litoralis TaxID=39960 RepID=A0A074MFS1_9SPHN|nr:3-deoxy-manno-octulosonate cytidylyltransferase [Erythrobacter litoralis]AOL22045.1 3-deoxy-manno-octulosonate cytidylyltransferase (CMP-KDO synthetase) [Erythrobacter litoralis]KEO90698.1 3-deoxy-manno-octulosonate cytidylyltransferase [Erythrobacter litoralis]